MPRSCSPSRFPLVPNALEVLAKNRCLVCLAVTTTSGFGNCIVVQPAVEDVHSDQSQSKTGPTTYIRRAAAENDEKYKGERERGDKGKGGKGDKAYGRKADKPQSRGKQRQGHVRVAL